MGAAESASKQMKTGLVNEISLKTEKGTIILLPAGSKAILTTLTETEAQIGLILFEMESIAEQDKYSKIFGITGTICSILLLIFIFDYISIPYVFYIFSIFLLHFLCIYYL